MISDSSKKEIETNSNKSLDDTMRQNAENAENAGLEVRVTRIYDGVGVHDGKDACQWCLDRECTNVSLEEAYDIGAFQRHPGCECIIEYTNARGEKTYQVSKGGWSSARELEERLSAGLTNEIYADELASRVDKYIDIDAGKLLNDAKSGGVYSGLYDQSATMTKPQLEKAIRSHIKQAELHEWKIQNPSKFMTKHDANNKIERTRAIRKWERDRRRNSQMARIEIEIWRDKYGH